MWHNMVMVIIGLVLLGLAFGSFVNALVWRLHEKRSIAKGRSMCVHCHHTLSWLDLLPVLGWVMLRGRCRYCRRSISAQYPLVELAAAGLFVLSYVAWPRELGGGYEQVYFGIWLSALVLMLALTVYDLRWLSLPDKLNWPFVLTGVTSLAVAGSRDVGFTAEHLAGMVLAGGFFATLYYGSRGRWLGGGDVKFALGMGAWLGWKLTVVAMLTAFYSASLVILPLLLMKVVKRRQPVPFGPFLIAGTITAMLYGQDLIDWYASTFLPAGL